MAENPKVGEKEKESLRKSDRLKRHRERNVSFDLNRSSPQVQPKYRKINKSTKMANRPPHISDLSGTINVQQQNTGTRPKDRVGTRSSMAPYEPGREEVAPNVRQMVTDSVENMRTSLDRSMEKIISEKIGREMQKVQASMNLLSDAIRSLSVRDQVRPQTPENVFRPVEGGQPPSYARVHRYDFPPPPVANVHNDTWRIRVDKFGLEFKGGNDQLSVEEFIFRLEHMQRQYRIPWQEILRDFHLLVAGTVKQWYWALLQTTVISDWTTLRLALLNRYKTIRSNWELMQELVERKQRQGESIDEYFHNLNLLRARLEVPVAEGEMIKIAKRNLKENIARIVYPMNVSSVEQLRMECLEAERIFIRNQTRTIIPQQSRPQRYIHEIVKNFDEDEQAETVPEVASIDSPPVCWNCQQEGHVFRDCLSRQRNLFCYKCGRPDTITPKCPICSNEQGNSRRNVGITGLPRSTELAPRQPQN